MAMVRKAYYGRTPSKSPVKRVRKGKRAASKKAKKAAKRTGSKRRSATGFAAFVKKYSAAKKKAMGGNVKQTAVMKALGADWRKGIRSY
jgi:hypothetical protein